MQTRLEQLRRMTTVVADTGDIEAIRKWRPVDATTNPSLLLKAVSQPEYEHFIDDALAWAGKQGSDPSRLIEDAGDMLAVMVGREVLEIIPGRISTEVDARLSFDSEATVARVHRLIDLYAGHGVGVERILIKIASTWEGIRAAERLQRDGINCNLTLLFSMAQARACADAGVFLISPFVGRILDWYKAKEGHDFAAAEDPGVHSVQRIYRYYKRCGYPTEVMGASFRNIGEILELAGCDRLTISPALMQELEASDEHVERRLFDDGARLEREPPLKESEMRWQLNEDAMASEKLGEGIRSFTADQLRLEKLLSARV
ncbi:transaldolase [Mariprofundus ferrinatatus]|uniref:Transaldolase n=1 Tax=Mariprofundus ferrinatatus TaxID=1921087 RepID=A0A2K8L6T4_9PROT|nr:transaldolase [Mariprofundus ferrinatatus]ATX82987.1 transaldolase [Mariprofundus ferrinatatus]